MTYQDWLNQTLPPHIYRDINSLVEKHPDFGNQDEQDTVMVTTAGVESSNGYHYYPYEITEEDGTITRVILAPMPIYPEDLREIELWVAGDYDIENLGY